jgi:hypothetical protein
MDEMPALQFNWWRVLTLTAYVTNAHIGYNPISVYLLVPLSLFKSDPYFGPFLVFLDKTGFWHPVVQKDMYACVSVPN